MYIEDEVVPTRWGNIRMSWMHQFSAPRLKHEWTGGVSDHSPVFTKVALNKVVSGVEAEEVQPGESGGLLYPLTRHNTVDKLERFETILLDKLTTAILLLGGGGGGGKCLNWKKWKKTIGS
jgi:hypothetical protein